MECTPWPWRKTRFTRRPQPTTPRSARRQVLLLTSGAPVDRRADGVAAPPMTGAECLHSDGVDTYQYNWNYNVTVFPAPIALGASFDAETARAVGAAIASEQRAKANAALAAGEWGWSLGALCFAPVLNLARDPRWGRLQARRLVCVCVHARARDLTFVKQLAPWFRWAAGVKRCGRATAGDVRRGPDARRRARRRVRARASRRRGDRARDGAGRALERDHVVMPRLRTDAQGIFVVDARTPRAIDRAAARSLLHSQAPLSHGRRSTSTRTAGPRTTRRSAPTGTACGSALTPSSAVQTSRRLFARPLRARSTRARSASCARA